MTEQAPSRTECIWITGASSGIGKALAERFAKDRARIAISARSADVLEEIAADLRKQGAEVFVAPLDVTDADAARTAVERITTEFGPIATAAFSAGTYQAVMGDAVTVENARPIVDLNLMGSINCMTPVIEHMKARGQGRIAFVASLAGYFGLPNASIYGATKAGVIAMAESLRPDLARFGIKVQVVNPGFIRTPLTMKNEFPMPFLMEVEDAAEAFYKGLHSDRFEITFPRVFSLILRGLQLLPYPLAFAATRRMVPKEDAPREPSGSRALGSS